jgi:hypothetical protein
MDFTGLIRRSIRIVFYGGGGTSKDKPPARLKLWCEDRAEDWKKSELRAERAKKRIGAERFMGGADPLDRGFGESDKEVKSCWLPSSFYRKFSAH